MASAEILDISRLASPIEGESPVGTDLRSDASPTSPYYQVKDARSSARAIERQALMNGEAETEAPDWGPVLDLGPDLLASSAKDLEIAAYLVEALVRVHGFAGLRDGFKLVRELVENFGDDIFPLPDEDGIETRVAPLTGLNGEGAEGTLLAPIKNVPITDDTSVGQFSCAHYQQGLELERVDEDVRARRIEQGAVASGTFRQAVAETSAEFYQALVEDLDGAIEEFANLSDVLDSKYGSDAPPTSAIRGALDEAKDTILTIARDKLDALAPDEPVETEEEGSEVIAGDGAKPQVPAGTIQTREDAFRAIEKVADFFRRTEPHTPISYALDRIIRWGRMPLPDLWREIITDETTVDQMFRLVGIDKPRDAEGEEY